jgi:TetR/AcrR family transcriptional regulator, lmrAB and yxaGH operons repressor
MPRRSTARERMIAAAGRLFQRQGYHGTGVAQILEEAQAPKGSFYHHFAGGKEELAAIAVKAAGTEIIAIIDAAFAKATSFSEGANNVAERVGAWFERSDYAEGCPITAVHLETTPLSDRLTIATREVFACWCDCVANHARRLGLADAPAKDCALGLVLAIEGAWVLARARRSRDPFVLAARMAVGLAHCP